MANAKEFPTKGRTGMEIGEVSETPQSLLEILCIHVYCSISCVCICGHNHQHDYVIAPVVHASQAEEAQGLVAAITMFKQATKASATPTSLPSTEVICQDPWVSFVLTCITILGIVAYVIKHGRHLSLIYGHKFTNICKIYVLVSSQTHYVKLKIAEICGNPNLLTFNKELELIKLPCRKAACGITFTYCGKM